MERSQTMVLASLASLCRRCCCIALRENEGSDKKKEERKKRGEQRAVSSTQSNGTLREGRQGGNVRARAREERLCERNRGGE